MGNFPSNAIATKVFFFFFQFSMILESMVDVILIKAKIMISIFNKVSNLMETFINIKTKNIF